VGSRQDEYQKPPQTFVTVEEKSSCSLISPTPAKSTLSFCSSFIRDL